ncbi:MAG: FkbM family methyltransferase [Thermodesulfobacteriota bacterium]
MKGAKAIFNWFKQSVLWLWYRRNHIPILNFPIPWRLSYGGWFLIYSDEMGLNLISRLWQKSRSYEEGELKFVQRFVKPGMICFDIGANQGFYTVLLSRQVSLQGKVFAFEPVTSEFRKLKRNIQINRCSSVTVLERMGVSSHEGVADMFVCLDGHGSRSSMRQPPEEVKARTKVQKVSMTTLDSYVRKNNISRIDFIKIDVEGSEIDVLGGGQNVLGALHPVILIEMADVVTQQFGYRAVEVYRFLEDRKFVLFEVTPTGLLKPARPKDTYRENLIAVPNRKVDMISHLAEETKQP